MRWQAHAAALYVGAMGWIAPPCLAGKPLPAAGSHGHYAVLTATPDRPAPFGAVDFGYGPREEVGGEKHVWWQLELRAKDEPDAAVMLRLRALTREDPMAAGGRLRFARYLLHVPETNETLEYRSARTDRALLPPWRDFRRHFIPRAATGSRRRSGLPETCRYLGHVLTLRRTAGDVPWRPWKDVRLLRPDPELLVGTGRSVKDTEHRRLPQKPKRRNYTYAAFTADDYATMIQAGMNLFTVRPEQERFVRAESVFYLRGAGGKPALRFPADLYRGNYLGTTMFMDEPTIRMVGDKLIHNSLRYFSDAAAVLRARVKAAYASDGSYGSFSLERKLKARGVAFGDMRLQQHDYPSWETIFETAHYQLAGGLAGIVHEGRYQLAPFDAAVAKWTGRPRRHTPRELLRYHFAFLRGAARAFGKHWGTSIYGQCDPAIAREAVTLAHDMGARYVWFWTSDHDHHVPWPEQLALARRLKRHAAQHPRASIFAAPPVRGRAIVLPYGTFISLRNLWWVRVLDPEGTNEASRRYRRLMRETLRACHEALDAGEDFDVVIDTGRPPAGYRHVARIHAPSGPPPPVDGPAAARPGKP